MPGVCAGRIAARRFPAKLGLAAFDFEHGTLLFTEAGSRKQASLHLVRGAAAVAAMDPGGAEPLAMSRDAFAAALRSGNHTLKRMLTDPHVFSGIGNAYSDEILHARAAVAGQADARDDRRRDRAAVRRHPSASSPTGRERLQEETGDTFPEKVTAFRPGMAVHGRYGKPCPRCGAPVQRIVYARNEANYCAPCQTGGRLLADRALSRLLREDWPKTLEALEQAKRR